MNSSGYNIVGHCLGVCESSCSQSVMSVHMIDPFSWYYEYYDVTEVKSSTIYMEYTVFIAYMLPRKQCRLDIVPIMIWERGCGIMYNRALVDEIRPFSAEF